MINDVTPPEPRSRRKLKRIEPISKPNEVPIYELAAREDPEFKTPEETAVTDFSKPEPTEEPTSAATVVHHEAPKTSKFSSKRMPKLLGPGKKAWWPRTKKQQIIWGAVVVVLAFGIGAGWTLTHHKRAVVAVAPKKAVVKVVPPKIIYSTLTGLPVADETVNQRPVTGVMIENSIDARPQSGLGDAGVVFEAVAEGGVTRYLALFQDTAPADVGPIRSARPYYVSWDMGFDAAYAHVGGSPDGLADITAWGTKDMNQFYNGGSYHRITSRDAPHNVYTAISTLNQLEAAKGYTSTYTGFVRKKEQPYKAPAPTPVGKTPSKTTTPPDTRTPASTINFSLSGYTYDPQYVYNAATNSYDRSEAGTPQTDANTGKQLSPKVVIAMVMSETQGALDSSGAYYSNYTTVGSGQAYVFQDGALTMGTWSKAGNSAPLTFTDASGAPLPLNPGQTWISAVTATNRVSYK